MDKTKQCNSTELLYLSCCQNLCWWLPHWWCVADKRLTLLLPCAWAWSTGTSCKHRKRNTNASTSKFFKLPFLRGPVDFHFTVMERRHLSVLLSMSSQRSSATRNTDLRLIGREMVWTWPSSTSRTSSWFLSVQSREHVTKAGLQQQV